MRDDDNELQRRVSELSMLDRGYVLHWLAYDPSTPDGQAPTRALKAVDRNPGHDRRPDLLGLDGLAAARRAPRRGWRPHR